MLAAFAPLAVTLSLPAVTLPGPGDELAVPAYGVTADGPGVLAARAVARQGFAASAYGPVGDDGFGREVADALAADGVATAGLSVRRESRTACRVVCSGDDGRFLALRAAGAAGLARDDDLPSEALAGGTGLLGHSGLPAAAVASAFSRAREAGGAAVLHLAAEAAHPPSHFGACDFVVAGWPSAYGWARREGLSRLPAPALVQALAARWGVALAVSGVEVGTIAADGTRLLIQPDLAAAGPSGEAVLAGSLAVRVAAGTAVAAALPAAAAAASLVGEDNATALPTAEDVTGRQGRATPLRTF